MFQSFFSDAAEFFPVLMQGVLTTIAITAAALVIATALGLFWALLRVSGVAPLSHASRILTNIIRGVPIIVVLFYMYFVLPEIGISLTAFQAGALGLGDDPARAFLTRGRVALTRGLDFGTGGAGFARLNIGTSGELLREAVRRMRSSV
jgi:His/Glu/Gln/Arg/opine family amino acid ABC transporter permease subunit